MNSDIKPEAEKVAVRFRNVGKSFVLSKSSDPQQKRFAWRKPKKAEDTIFWALRDINFEVQKGQALGILGLNGAGKSTLLGIVAATLQPTLGSTEVNGQVQFLRLGAGFVADLSGRQNVIAHAKARGVSAAETERRVDYVESFSDIGPFFDQPMRSYSSGMYGRVAFGNAFAVNPEILIVDEALAVGDAVFVNKCYRKIQEIRERGTTILFTSHSSDAVLRLCDKGIVLHKGELVGGGTAREAVKTYSTIVLGDVKTHHETYDDRIENIAAASDFVEIEPSTSDPSKLVAIAGRSGLFRHSDGVDRMDACGLFNGQEMLYGKGGARIAECAVLVNGVRHHSPAVQLGSKVELFFRVHFAEDISQPNFGITVSDEQGIMFHGVNQLWKGQKLKPTKAGESVEYRVIFTANLAGGNWFLSPAVADGLTVLQQREAAVHLKVVDDDRTYIGNGWMDLDFGRLGTDVETDAPTAAALAATR